MKNIFFPSNQLPVLYQGDVIIAGGSFTGIAAALVLSQAGKQVTLVEPRTYLGREITATLRPWLHLGLDPLRKGSQSDISTNYENIPNQNPSPPGMPAWLELLATSATQRKGWQSFAKPNNEIPLHLDQLKIYLEDLLLAAKVHLVYASSPVQILETAGRVEGLIIGNKSGRQIIEGKLLVDATETALCARLAGAAFETAPETALYASTIELTGAQDFPERILTVPGDCGINENSVWLHDSYAGKDPMYIEFHMRLPAGDDFPTAMQRDLAARQTSLKLASYLLNRDVRFYWGNWTGSALELYGQHTSPMTNDLPAWSVELSDQVMLPLSQDKTINLPLFTFAGPLEGLWSLNEAARFRQAGEFFQDAVISACLGEAWARIIAGADTGSRPGHLSLSEKSVTTDSQKDKSKVPILVETEVLVVGGGTSGATAAAASARLGSHSVLMEMNPGLGGTGTFGGIVTYWMGNHGGFVPKIKHAVEKIHSQIHFQPHPPWMMWNNEAKKLALLGEALDAGVQVYWNATCVGAVVKQNKIAGAFFATRYGPAAVLGQVCIDATGDGDLAAFAGAECVVGNEDDETLMWSAFPYIHTPGAGNSGNFTGATDVTEVLDLTRGILAGRRRNWTAERTHYQTWPGKKTGLQSVKPIPLEEIIHDHGIYLAPRESRHIWGDVVLTLTDQLRQRQWPDVIVKMFSNYDVKGQSTTDWNRIGLLPPNLEIEFPYRALLPRGLDGLLVAGKAFSARSDAVPSIRMQPDLENLGGAVGIAAALAVQTGCSPRKLDIRLLQEYLVREGVLDPKVLSRILVRLEYSTDALERLTGQIQAEPALWEYNNMPLDVVFREKIPLVEVVTAGERAIPVLANELDRAGGKRSVLIAQALALLGSSKGVPVLVHRLQEYYSEESLPPRSSFMFNANQYAPDQGAMPESVYLLYSLGMARDARSLPVWEEVADLLDFSLEDLWDGFSAPLLYIDAVCYGAERLGDGRMVPILEKLHSHPLLHNRWRKEGFEPDFIQERIARCEITIGRALARCGSRSGYQILIEYLEDVHSVNAKAAHLALKAISGEDLPKDLHQWAEWLQKQDHPETCSLQ